MVPSTFTQGGAFAERSVGSFLTYEVSMPTILVVDDDRSVRHLIRRYFADTEFAIAEADSICSALQIIEEQKPDALLLDILLEGSSGLDAFDEIHGKDPRLPIIYITASGNSDTAIQAMKLGAYEYLVKPLEMGHLEQVLRQAVKISKLMRVPVQVGESIAADNSGDQIIGTSAAMQEVFKGIGRVAGQNVTVLIRGESGTGKELVARAVYQHSHRNQAPFLAVNCAAIPEQLLESELFGHEKGSFTGADRQRIGKFEQCNHGTLFLDEIGDMPLVLQSKILRLLQLQEFQRVGGNEMIRTDVRIIAATNRPLEAMVREGDFREDLLYRLNGYTIWLPPLRERGGDLMLLAKYILSRLGHELSKQSVRLAPETVEMLEAHRWPGNVRELESVLRHGLLRTTGNVLLPESFPSSFTCPPRELASFEPELDGSVVRPLDLNSFLADRLAADSNNLYAETLEAMERFLLTKVLTLTQGNQSEASRLLGITRGSLRNKIRSLGIVIESRIESGT